MDLQVEQVQDRHLTVFISEPYESGGIVGKRRGFAGTTRKGDRAKAEGPQRIEASALRILPAAVRRGLRTDVASTR